MSIEKNRNSEYSSVRVSENASSEIPFSTLIDSIPAIIAYVDSDMMIQYYNQPFKKWFSIADECVGKSFTLIVGKQIFDQLQRHMGKVLSGERAHFQMSINMSEGRQWLEATLSPHFNGTGDVTGFIFHSTDITEKSRTEQVLKDYFENATIGFHWVDGDGIILWANPAELKMLGYSEAEYVGHHISEFHADKIVSEDILNRLANRQTLINREADMCCKDGSIRNVSMNSTVLWEDDKFIHTRCFTIDVTEQKAAANAVRESEEKFKMITNLAPLVIWATDRSGDCTFLSAKWEELTGTKIEDGLREPWMNLIHPHDKENILFSWMRALSERAPFEAKFRLLNVTGEHLVAFCKASPKFTATGEFSGYIGVLQDISSEEDVKYTLEKIVLDRTEDLRKRNSELRIAEKALYDKNQELEEINNQLSSFAHIASHDLQEPLRKIQTYSELLLQLDGNKFSAKGKQHYDRIQDSSERMKKLIQDLLAYSKSNDNQGKLEQIDLNLIFDEVINELEVKIEEKNATIENHGLPELKGIRFQFHQLLLNLLSNALKFSLPGVSPVIILNSEILSGNDVNDLFGETVHNYYHISVADNGIGFEAEAQGRIFEMFQRLHTRTHYEGSGIGLAICKKIVENNKGRLIAEGKPNEGATFHIFLPKI